MSRLHYRLRVNAESREVRDAYVTDSLLTVLRDRLGLYGTKGACEQGECGSCSVLIDGDLVCACLVLAASVAETDIVTVEGIGVPGVLTDVQQAFIDQGAVQCGFCTPGLVVAVEDLLRQDAAPSELHVKEALSGNICRCTGYGRIFAAVEQVVALRGAR